MKVVQIEIFIALSASNMNKDIDSLLHEFRVQLAEWKKQNKFPHPINITLDPKQWKFEVGI